ncbi:MAG TPA: hypothetical protein VFU01_08185 [Gemmatimonadaceae bacterium]|nr:hypothetical protein [Gemmatimonadaceae bacterium]
MSITGRVTGGILASLILACSVFRGGTPAALDGPAVIRVENGSHYDVSVFFVQRGERLRLGSVSALSAGSFDVPARLIQSANEAQLVADPVGIRARAASERFVIRPGQRMVWTIDSSLQRTSISIY